MTIIFSDGFESGFSAWTGTINTPIVTSDKVHHGNYSMYVDGNNHHYVYKDFTSTNIVYGRGYFYAPTTIQWSNRYFPVMGFRGTNLIGMAEVRNEQFLLCYRDAGNFFTMSVGSVEMNRWYCVELYLNIGDAGETALYIDGVLVASISGIDNNDRGNATRVCFGQYPSLGWALTRAYYDCCVVSEDYIGTEVTNRLLTGVGLGCVSSP